MCPSVVLLEIACNGFIVWGDVLLQLQTCILRVNIHCDGCKKKVKKLLHKIDGTFTVTPISAFL